DRHRTRVLQGQGDHLGLQARRGSGARPHHRADPRTARPQPPGRPLPAPPVSPPPHPAGGHCLTPPAATASPRRRPLPHPPGGPCASRSAAAPTPPAGPPSPPRSAAPAPPPTAATAPPRPRQPRTAGMRLAPAEGRLITDLGHTNRDETDMIMTKSRDKWGR